MPRVACGTAGRAADAARKREERMNEQLDALGERVTRIIRREMAVNGVRNNRALVKLLAENGFNICETSLGKRMNRQIAWDLPSLFAVADALNMSDESRAAMLGGGTWA